MLSRRAHSAVEPNEFAKLLADSRANGHSYVDLCISNPTRAGLPYPESELRAAFADAPWLAYAPEPCGPLAARQAVARYLREQSIPSDERSMLLTASTSEAYGYLLKLLCNPNDVVLVPEPGYPLLSEICRYESVRLVPYQLHYDGAWHIDFPSVEAALARFGERVRALIVVSPNNPTGSMLKQAELARLLSFKLPIISDEVFSSYRLGVVPDACSVLDLNPEQRQGALVFRLDGLSKLAALPQLKLAFIQAAGDAARVAESLSALEYIADTYLSVNTLVLGAVPQIFQQIEPTRQALRQRLLGNLACLDRQIQGTAITRLHLEAGWYATLRLPLLSAEADWAEKLLLRGVAVQPGWFFDYEDARLVVVSLLTPEADFSRGLALIQAAVTDYG